VHTVVMYAEAADVDNVMVAGRFVKRNGELTFPANKMEHLRNELLDARMRMMREGHYVYKPAPRGPQPARFVL
jgi:5-methylthioadenosine/S-adenosylhomocysteine deaminase